MTSVVFTLTGLNGEPIPSTQFKVEAAAPDGVYDPEYIVPSPVTFTTDTLGQATVELTATNAPYFITRMTGSVDDFIAYKFFVPESTSPVEANMLYVDLGKHLKLNTDRSLYALIEAKVAMLHALDMATTVANIVPAETIRTATSISGARLLTGVGTGVSPRLQLLGGVNVLDGQQGVFIWDNSSTATDDGATVIKPTEISGGGRWIRDFSGPVNVKWFGAKGDGTSDDTAAFQAAIAYVAAFGGGQIDIPFESGEVYRANITISGVRGVHLHGTGWCKQSYANGTESLTRCIKPYILAEPVLTIGDNEGIGHSTLTSGTMLSNLAFSGSGATRGTTGIKIIGGAYRCIYDNVSILGFTEIGLHIVADVDTRVFYQFFTGLSIQQADAGSVCIYLDGSTSGTRSTNVTSIYFDKVSLSTATDSTCRGVVVKGAQCSFADTYIQLTNSGVDIGLELITDGVYADPNVTCNNLVIDTANGGLVPTVLVNIAGFTDLGDKPLSQYLRGTFSIDGLLKLQDGATNDSMVNVYSWHRSPIISDPLFVNAAYITNVKNPNYRGNYFAAGGGATPIVRLYAPNDFELTTGSFILPGNSGASPNTDGISSQVQFNKTLYANSVDATVVRLTSDGAAASGLNVPTVPLNGSVAFKGHVHAHQSTAEDTDGETGMWTIEGALTRNSVGNVSLVAAVTPTVVCRSATATTDDWVVTVTADNTLKALNVSFTSTVVGTRHIHVVCSLVLSEIIYA